MGSYMQRFSFHNGAVYCASEPGVWLPGKIMQSSIAGAVERAFAARPRGTRSAVLPCLHGDAEECRLQAAAICNDFEVVELPIVAIHPPQPGSFCGIFSFGSVRAEDGGRLWWRDVTILRPVGDLHAGDRLDWAELQNANGTNILKFGVGEKTVLSAIDLMYVV